MPDELYLPLLAAAALAWYLICALRQLRTEPTHSPTVVWRESTNDEWTEWTELDGVAASSGYDAMLSEVRRRASSTASAVQFGIVVQPGDAPDYTLRVLFMSAVRERSSDRVLTSTGHEG